MLMLVVVDIRLEQELVGRLWCLSIAYFAVSLPALFPLTSQTSSIRKTLISLRVNLVGGSQHFIRVLTLEMNLLHAGFVIENI